MAADRPYGEFYDFYSVSPEYFGYSPVCEWVLPCLEAVKINIYALSGSRNSVLKQYGLLGQARGLGVGSPSEDDNSVATQDRSHIAQLCTERAMPAHHS
jgi:hypothetical protein